MRVLIVDDSVVFRAAIRAALAGEADIEVAGAAATGRIALAKLRDDPVDVVICDLEMPDGDGLFVLEGMRDEGLKGKLILFAAPTQQSYLRVRKALELGAVEFLAKPGADTPTGTPEEAISRLKSELVPRVRGLLGRVAKPLVVSKSSAVSASVDVPKPTSGTGAFRPRTLAYFKPRAIVIASSTGGPLALEKAFAPVRPPLKVPILICQHMPPVFTKELAARLAEITGAKVAEGRNGEPVVAGQIYVAPGDYHMQLKTEGTQVVIELTRQPPVHFVRPAADPLFQTAAAIYGEHLMGFVFTGMGEDGKEGACTIKRAGGGIMIQDKATSVVWGMPGAVHEAGAFDRVGSLEECSGLLSAMARGGDL